MNRHCPVTHLPCSSHRVTCSMSPGLCCVDSPWRFASHLGGGVSRQHQGWNRQQLLCCCICRSCVAAFEGDEGAPQSVGTQPTCLELLATQLSVCNSTVMSQGQASASLLCMQPFKQQVRRSQLAISACFQWICTIWSNRQGRSGLA